MANQTSPGRPEQRAPKRRVREDRVLIAACSLVLLGAIGSGLFSMGRAFLLHKLNPANKPYAENSAVSTTAVTTITTTTAATTTTTTTTTAKYPAAAQRTTETVTLPAGDTALVIARNAVLVACDETGSAGTLLVERGADEAVNPASLTKIMTMVTFFALCPDVDPDSTIIMEQSVIDACRAEMAYCAGFQAGETCKIRDLLYAMMLPSGADAAVMLATYAAGSEEQFVQEMNRLADDMGLSQTHFVNCVGLHNDAHKSSVSDLSRILCYALRDPLCRELMSTERYTTAPTEQHPAGIALRSTTLSRMNGNELENLADPLHIIGGKTGYTTPAGQCLATWAEDAAGNRWICVVTGSTPLRSMDAVSDTLTLYQYTAVPAENVTRCQLNEEDILDPPDHF